MPASGAGCKTAMSRLIVCLSVRVTAPCLKLLVWADTAFQDVSSNPVQVCSVVHLSFRLITYEDHLASVTDKCARNVRYTRNSYLS